MDQQPKIDAHTSLPTICKDRILIVKHALGLRTQASRLNLRAALLYLYSEPKSFPVDQRCLKAGLRFTARKSPHSLQMSALATIEAK